MLSTRDHVLQVIATVTYAIWTFLYKARFNSQISHWEKHLTSQSQIFLLLFPLRDLGTPDLEMIDTLHVPGVSWKVKKHELVHISKQLVCCCVDIYSF